MSPVAITVETPVLEAQAKILSQKLNCPVVAVDSNSHAVLLHITPEKIGLKLTVEKNQGMVYVDFLAGALKHRRQFGGGKNQLIARAIGMKSRQKLSVVDATAGLGRDAFVLATLGCDVLMCERSPIVAELLQDGLKRASTETWFQQLSLSVKNGDASNYLASIVEANRPDVVYIDPMFPESHSTALVKKEMRVIRAVVGDDLDAVKLLDVALRVALRRVVVKRSRLAPAISDKRPSFVFEGKSSRFDVYLASG
ncbi:MAG: class I SAM-dependent methyltransferase [Coxiellaceae bacterium]|nr:class I SAM-dependent methyltransferase [Coxiellaceae bacterium]